MRGADEYALRAVVGAGSAACQGSVVYLPGRRPAHGDGVLGALVGQGGRVVEGPGFGREALLARSRRLAREAAGVVAFLWGPSRGSVYTLRAAVRAGTRVAVVVAGGGAVLPAFPSLLRVRAGGGLPLGGRRPDAGFQGPALLSSPVQIRPSGGGASPLGPVRSP